MASSKMYRAAGGSVVAMTLALGGCMGPVEPDIDYEIELAVTSTAPADYSFEVDGASGEVRAVACVDGCAWETGDVLAELPLSKRMAIESQFELAGFLDLEQTEFGVACCGSPVYTLTYRKGGREHSVHGSAENLPADIAELIEAVESTLEPE